MSSATSATDCVVTTVSTTLSSITSTGGSSYTTSAAGVISSTISSTISASAISNSRSKFSRIVSTSTVSAIGCVVTSGTAIDSAIAI